VSGTPCRGEVGKGHGWRETGHVVDALEPGLAWYRRYFQ